MTKIKYLIIFAVVCFSIISSIALTNKTLAQETNGTENIQYPVKELGNCQDKAACKAYCDKPENMEACLNFAEKNSLMSKEEVTTAKKFTTTRAKKPGNCTTKDSCETYCNEISHIDECVAFAEESGLAAGKDLAEAKKVQAAIKKGIKPPACGNKKACDTYCDSPEHMEECVSFGEAAGFVQGKELEDAKKVLMAIKKGVTPPPCRGKEACDEYCSNPDNMEACMTFAMEAGFMSPQEMGNTQKMLTAIKKGVKPPPCKGKDECDAYCQQEEHLEECLNFSEAAGFMTAEEAAISRKTGGKGPGGCKDKNECEAFCNNPDNQETCFNFGKQYGLIPEEDLKKMEEGKQQFKQGLAQAPQEVLDCLSSQIGSDTVEKIKSGELMPSQKVGDAMRGCFERIGRPPSAQGGTGGGAGMMNQGQAPQAGPGGCKTPEECETYCKSHLEECMNFQPTVPQGAQGPQMQQGTPTPGQMPTGPGGCKTPEECQTYCTANPQECQGFQAMPSTPGGTGGGGGMGIPNEQSEEMIKVQPVCQSAEQCQQVQQQIQQQIQQQVQQQIQNQTQQTQNQMTPPQPCQGEGCNYGPPPNLSGGGQMPQQPTGGYPSPMTPPPPSESTSGGGSIPTGPYPSQPQPMQQPQQYQEPPQQPTPGGTTPAPSGFIAPQTFLGSIISTLKQKARPER